MPQRSGQPYHSRIMTSTGVHIKNILLRALCDTLRARPARGRAILETTAVLLSHALITGQAETLVAASRCSRHGDASSRKFYTLA